MRWFHLAVIAIESVLAGVVASLNLDEADIQTGVAIIGETQSPGHMDRTDYLV